MFFCLTFFSRKNKHSGRYFFVYNVHIININVILKRLKLLTSDKVENFASKQSEI